VTLPDWVHVGYSELIDGRRPSHSGDSIELLLRRLGGRALDGEERRPGDRQAHALLEPLLEPYAFVLPDAIDTLIAPNGAPLLEVGSLWGPGAEQPAWVELLRARRYVVESDGAQKLRLFLPLAEATAAGTDSATAAEEAYRAAWPVLRHVFAAERTRLANAGVSAPVLKVRAFPYRHHPERSEFSLGTQPARFTVASTRPDGSRPPLDVVALQRFLENALLLEGARLGGDGDLRWLGSETESPPTLLGRPLALSDFAVAYRAIFHGGLTEPYMSLDRGYSPQTFMVNYGGRLRDTALGMVSLLADIRFKTFSQGIDIATGKDVRETVRRELPDFGTHLEHMTWDPLSADVATQQTRLWFYPDDVDLTVSAQGDVVVLRKVRMSAASERLEGLDRKAASEQPWTLATVSAINREYERLARLFPEMADLDQVVRLLAVFTWLRHAEASGQTIPELDVLLTQRLPELPTPRLYPQLLAFNATPSAGSRDPVDVYERVDVVEALDRLRPITDRPLPAARRYERAVGRLDAQDPDHAALLRELGAVDPSRRGDTELDLMTYRAERLLMHERVLGTLDPVPRDALADRLRGGEKLRIFSIGIGGIDLGMEKVLARAEGQSLDLGAGGFGFGAAPGRASEQGRDSAEAPSTGSEPTGPREAWQDDPGGLQETPLPEHGLGSPRPVAGTVVRSAGNLIEIGPGGEKKTAPKWILAVYGESGPEPRSRRLLFDGGKRVSRIERVENRRLIRYRFDLQGERLTASLVDDPLAPDSRAANEAFARAAPLEGLALMLVAADPWTGDAAESAGVPLTLRGSVGGVRRDLQAAFPRGLLRRLVLGRQLDLTRDRPLSGLAPLPGSLGPVETMMVFLDEAQARPPWDGGVPAIPGEEDPIRLARALTAWWSFEGQDGPRAVVGVDPGDSVARWFLAPTPKKTLLLMPDDAFPETRSGLSDDLRRAWGADAVVSELTEGAEVDLVVLVSAEAPGRFGRRLRDLAGDPALDGKLLAAWCLSGPIREDLPAEILAATGLAGLALADSTITVTRAAADRLAELRAALDLNASGDTRVERMPGPFLWYF